MQVICCLFGGTTFWNASRYGNYVMGTLRVIGTSLLERYALLERCALWELRYGNASRCWIESDITYSFCI
jgi:hypothetical protein